MTRRLSRAEIGHAVFACLVRSQPTIEEALKETGLSRAQWHTGLDQVRTVLGGMEPVAYDAATHRYKLTISDEELERYISARLNRFKVQLRLLYDGAFVPSEVVGGTPRLAAFHLLDHQVRELLDHLDRETIN